MANNNNEMRFVGVNQPNQNHANNNGNFSLQPYSSSGSGSGSGSDSRSLQADHMIFYDSQSTWMMEPYSTVPEQALAHNGGGQSVHFGGGQSVHFGGGQSVHFGNDLQDQVPSFGDVAPYSAMSGMRPQGFGNQSCQYEFDRMYPQVENSNNLSVPYWALQPTYNQQYQPNQATITGAVNPQMLNSVMSQTSIPSGTLQPTYSQQHQLNQATITGAVNPQMLNSVMSQTSIPSGGMAEYPSGAILSSNISVHHQAQPSDVHRQEGFLSMLNPNQVQYYQGSEDNNLSPPYISIPQNSVHIPNQIYEPKNTRIGTLFDPSLKLFVESEFFDKYNRP